MSSTDPRRSYRIGPKVRGGLVPGVSTSQFVAATAAFGVALMALRALRGPEQGVVAVASVCSGAVIAWLPIRGATAQEWAPVVARQAARHLLRIDSHRPRPAERAVAVPSPFSRLSFEQITVGGRADIGVLFDTKSATAKAILQLGGEAHALLSLSEQDRRVEQWTALLAGLANRPGSLDRVQFVARSVRDRGEELKQRLERARTGADDLRGAFESYRTLLEKETAAAYKLECYLVLSISDRRLSREVDRDQSTQSRLGRAGDAAAREVLGVEQRCRAAGLGVLGVLNRRAVGALLASCCDEDRWSDGTRRPWPVALEEKWDHLRLDASVHATYWIVEWPRNEISAGFLAPLILRRSQRQRLSIVMAPLPPTRAARAAEHARTEATADNVLRQRHGFAVTARTRREHEGIAQRELELSDGHGAYRFTGYLTVSASCLEDLERACARVEQDAAVARLEIRRLYGGQLEGFFCTMPLGNGCP